MIYISKDPLMVDTASDCNNNAQRVTVCDAAGQLGSNLFVQQASPLIVRMQGRTGSDYGRNDVRVHWWVQYELAARKIQRQFRCWSTARHFRRNYARKMHLERIHAPRIPTLEEGFRNIISEDCAFEDKMAFWRGAIELRRAHKVHNTDLIVRSMIDSTGELSRAVVLLGTKDYAIVNKAEIPMKLRRIFMPKVESTPRQSEYHHLMMSSLRRTLNITDNADDLYNDGTHGRQNNVNLIRALRGGKSKQIVYQQDRADLRAELFSILNSVVERSYFSKNHIGHKDYKKNQKIPGQATVRSKEYLAKHHEILRSGTLDNLLAKTAYGNQCPN